MRKRILYVVSNLRSTGPVNQMSYIISHLDREKYDCRILTLSREPSDSKYGDFLNLGIRVDSLNLTRLEGVFKGRRLLKSFINDYSPDIIQSQGIRADSLINDLNLNIPWITTSRNYPYEDYPQKFGKVKGSIMAFKHLKVLRSCNNLISCSESISSKLTKKSIASKVICNGVPFENTFKRNERRLSKINVISVGSLIERKNYALLIDAFRIIQKKNNNIDLTIIGDGPLYVKYLELASSNIHFTGSVTNVIDYLDNGDLFISSSLSEGLPNTVLEAVSKGLPLMLSNISPHLEITNTLPPESCSLFSLDISPENLAQQVLDFAEGVRNINRKDIFYSGKENFSEVRMSESYQEYYGEVIDER